MARYPEAMQRLITALMKLPGLGPRSAQRIAFHILRSDEAEAQELAQAVGNMKSQVRFCFLCGNLTSRETCRICGDPKRDRGVICVTEEPKDVIALEQTGSFTGVYHVLMGKIAPLEGIGPEHLRIKELVKRVKKESPREIILALSSDAEGETTALYLARVLKPLQVKITRLASGVPVGSSLDFIDPTTLARALEGRRDV